MQRKIYLSFSTLISFLALFSVNLQGQRSIDDLEAIFYFGEGQGNHFVDQSHTGVPVLLEAEQSNAFDWLPGSGIEVNNELRLRSVNDVSSMVANIRDAGEFTLEAWIKAANSSQDGPARIITNSSSSASRNFMLGQNGDHFVARVRTTDTGINGTPNFSTPSGSVSGDIQHLVFTFETNGQLKFYLDGEEVASDQRTGDLSNWELSYRLGLLNEFGADRDWQGEMHLSAIYSRALSASEVGQNYNAGYDMGSASAPQEATCDEDCWIDGFGDNRRLLWLPNLPGNIHLNFELDEDGGQLETFEDGTAHFYGNLINMEDEGLGFYMDVWFTDRMNWEEWSALGRSWKGEPGIVGNLYETWDYYIVDPTKENVLIGTGGLEGSLLDLTHKPSNYHYGFQLGEAANDQNAEYGMSCWFWVNGEVNGEDFSGQCDINAEGECADLPVLACAVDVDVDCDASLDPEALGYPVLYCPDEYTLTYSDEWVSTDCPMEMIRTWTATDTEGNSVECIQTVTISDTEAPQINPALAVVTDCFDEVELFSSYVSDNCDEDPDVTVEIIGQEWTSGEDCEPGMYRTQTPGGWGAEPSGNNPGTYLHAHFDEVFPDGLTIGCDNQLHFTSAQAITDFLPSGSSPTTLPEGTMTDPGDAYNNVLAGHLVALSLSLAFDAADPNFGSGELGLGNLIVNQGDFAGMTVGEAVALANQYIGGCASNYNGSDLTGVLSAVNENFVDGTMNGGFVDCDLPYDCYLWLTAEITATDECGNSTTATVNAAYVDEQVVEIPEIEIEITAQCDDIPDPVIEVESDCPWSSFNVEVIDNYYSGGCNTSIERVYIIENECGIGGEFIQYISIIDTVSPVLGDVEQLIEVACAELSNVAIPQATDNCDEDVEVFFSDEILGEGCEYQILRTYTAQDNCGNTDTAQQIIQVTDENAPEIIGLEPYLSVNCEDGVPYAKVSAIDDCTDEPAITMEESIETNDCLTTITRTYTAIDGCGNTTIGVQVIDVIDDMAPEFTLVPQDLEVSCGEDVMVDIPEAIDTCSEVEITWSDEIINEEGQCAQIQRTFMAEDECGNAAFFTQMITLIDNEAPQLLNIQASGNYSCSELSEASDVEAIDNCDEDVEIEYTETITGEGCDIQILRTWTAIDDCGNSVSASQLADLNDDEAPTFEFAPENVTVSCEAEISDASPVISDSCDPMPTLVMEETIDGSGCDYSITRFWTATDACGNSSTHTQVITVSDTEAPVFVYFPEDVQYSCNESPVLEEPVVEDNCSEVTLDYTESEMSNECGSTTLRTWTATDACGNSASQSQTVFVGDYEAPALLNVPENMVLDCGDDIPEPAAVLAEDECGSATIEFSENMLSGTCEGNFILVRTWTATDDCGNSANAIQTISFQDTTAPVFDSLPEDIIADCGNVPEPPVLTASDDCSDVTISFEVITLDGGCPNLQRTWTATDACGNTAMAIQMVFVDDVEAPLLTGIPDDITVDCNNIPDMPDPEVSDNCDEDVAVTVNVNIIGTGCEYTIIRTWIASDDCGNTTIISQSINVIDESAPIFVEAPGDLSIECAQLEGIPYPTAIDDCGATVQVTFEDQIVGEDPCEYDIVRTYTATDQCGNSAEAIQNIHVIDQTPPAFIGVPANLYVSCDDVPAPAEVSAVDACSEVTELSFQEQQFGEGCDYYLQRTWTATDACGNSASIAHLVYVSDTEGPVISGLENITVDCTEAWPELTDPVITDNCTTDPDFSVIEFSEDNGCSETLTRIYTATDDCGNSTVQTQTITRTDLTPPVLEAAPATITVNCSEIPESAVLSATDNCSTTVDVQVEDIYQGGSCPYTVLRTWTATDECGNVGIATQEILVIDEEAPVLSDLPLDITAECGAVPAPQYPTATDNCMESVPVMLTEEWSSNEDCSYELLRIFTATDLCGNTAMHTQLITVIDTEAPQFPQLSEELFVQCSDIPSFEMVSVTDGCDPDVTVTMSESVIQGECPTEQTRIREWTAIDACGNTASFTQTVFVVDETLPSLIGVPEDITVDCENIPPVPEVSGWDECQGDLPVEFTEEITITGEAQDGCELGNAMSPAGDVAIWLPTLNGYAENYVFGDEVGTLSEDPATGTAHVTGTVYNPANANQGWVIDIHLENAMDWTAWSALGRSYKDDLGFGEEYHEDWTYYEINNETSRLIGIGEFEGTELSLTHAPSSYYYGVQIGIGANNRNADYGMSGWFDISGTLNGAQVAGMGDIMTENNCCPDQLIERTWTVTDCSGNTFTYTQTITVSSLFEVTPLMFAQYSEEGEFDVTGSANEEFVLTFRLPVNTQVNVSMFDLGGNLIQEIYKGDIRDNAEYRIPVSKSGIAPGIYIFSIEGGGFLLSDRELKVDY